MSYGGFTRRLTAGLAVVIALGALGACKSESSPDTAAAGAPASSAVKYFGPDGYGKVTLELGEKDALATGELQTAPVSTVLGKNVYSFVGGPKPDTSRMAADAKIEKAAAKAEKNTDKSAQGYADDAKAFADSAQRIAGRLIAYLKAGGATYTKGELDSIAAPKDAATAEGIKRGSTVTDLKAAYGSKGLKSSRSAYELPVAGHPDWKYLFETDGGKTVLYMSLIPAK